MAGDWIKLRCDLATDPAVIGIAAATDCVDEDHVVGKLARLWAWADQQTADGICAGVTPAWINRFLGVAGFAEAMVQAGWLNIQADGIGFPGFDRHNSASAKRRARTAQRVAFHRGKKGNACVTAKCYIPAPLRKTIFKRDDNRCVYCGREKGQTGGSGTDQEALLTVDHVIPESAGGDASPNNLVTCCMKCNQQKAVRTPDDAGMPWPLDGAGKRYGSVTEALPEKRRGREEKSKDDHLDSWTDEKKSTLLGYCARVFKGPGGMFRGDLSEADRCLLLKVGHLATRGTLAEHWIADALEAIRKHDPKAEPIRNRAAYFQSMLDRRTVDNGLGSLNALLATIDLPADLMKPKAADAAGGE